MMDKSELNRLFQYGMVLTDNRADAFDLVHTAVEKCLRSFPDKASSLPYLRVCMRNQFIDDCRRTRRVAFESLQHTTSLIASEEDLEQLVIDQNQISIILGELSTADREIIFLWAVEEYTAREIAEYLNKPRNTILSRIHRIRKKILKTASQIEQQQTCEGAL